MDVIHTQGVQLILFLQDTFKGNADLMLFLSHLGDPRNAFLVYFPLAYFYDKVLGLKVMWIGVLSEWLNAILKWCLHGERPYWWVHHTTVYEDIDRPELKQYSLTCETGPGSPSGHAMVTSSVLYLIVIYWTTKSDTGNKFTSKLCGYTSVTAVMLCVCVSRCYIATHFPHQVVLGTLAGYLLAQLLCHIEVESVSQQIYTFLTIFLLISGPAVFYTIQFLGLDPEWSVTLATKWCARSEWVYLDTTLFFALTRDAASLLGIGLSVHLFHRIVDLQLQWTDTEHSPTMRMLYVIVSILITRGQEYIRIPHTYPVVFYALSFIKYSMLPFIIIVMIPFIGSIVFKLSHWDTHPVKRIKVKHDKIHAH